MNTVATNLLGRWVQGRHVFDNPTYVPPREGILNGYSKKELKTLTERQMTMYLADWVEEKVVAVTCDGQGEYAELVFWVLIDGKPRQLDNVTVMPEGWTPDYRSAG